MGYRPGSARGPRGVALGLEGDKIFRRKRVGAFDQFQPFQDLHDFHEQELLLPFSNHPRKGVIHGGTLAHKLR